MECSMEGPSRTHALLETVRKLLEMQHEEEEIPTVKGGLCEESTFAQESLCSGATPTAEELIVAVPTNKKRSVQRQGVPGGPCANCGTKDSPQWRRPSTKKIVLCNACGIYFSRHNTLPQRSSNNSSSSNKKKTSSAVPAQVPQVQATQDVGNESAGGEDEAITAAGPTHHMALLQQAACAAAAANEGPYTRRPSSHSNTSQTDVINMSQSSRRSSPSRPSQEEDEVMLDNLPAPPAAAVKQEDAAAAHSQSSTQQPVPIPAVPSRKRSLRAGSTSAPTSTPTASATNPTFSAPNAPPPPQAPAFAAHPQPWGPHPSQLLLLQQQQQLLHMRLLGGAFPTPPNPYLMRILASTPPHPQLLASQQSAHLPSLHHHMQQHQHALVLHHVHQMQQQQLHALGGLAHLSSVYTPHGAGLLGRGSTGVARGSEAGLSAPTAQQPSAHSRSASREEPIAASLVPPVSVQCQQQQRQQLHRLITTQPPAWPALPLTEYGNASPHLQQQQQQQQQQSQQQQRGADANSRAAQVVEGQAAVTCHLLSPSSQQLLQQQLPQQQSEEEKEDAADVQQRLLEPAAKRHQRQGSFGSGPEGATSSTAAHTMTTQGGQGGHSLKVIPSYACRGPRAVSASDATSSVAALQQQQLQQQLLQKRMAPTAPLLAAGGGGNGSGTAVSTMYRPAPCALSDC
ncbi:hypothetical protein DUNSADRAFT_9259 [Dunaliella salina]|uniref:GATA-type domain-containing protein n=1 Tax=Dunaliella salina TaxID=3046 RepID=A0ABQ7GHU5_DUNSA|nr:hypothetical protein DUNSADRAFT_9259 [Dunaliella salina]|eukprot:KAF5834184.1 hypothetical protein DUNSADRAFT_9259 [Dunaliella salina]